MTDIIERDFDKEVTKNGLPVFACFTTRWCQSCWATCLFADQLAKEYEGRVKFVKVDVEKIPHVSAGHRIVAVPTILVFKDSKPVKKLLGFQDRRSLKAVLNNVVAEEQIPQEDLVST